MERPTKPGHFSASVAGLCEDKTENSCIEFPVAVVLPAGGSGERTGLPTPKQFCTFLNRPLISYTVQAFERVSWIETVVVVVAKESVDLMTDIVQRFHHTKVRVVRGGPTRHRSIFNGVLALSKGENGSAIAKPKVVIIHDAVRPFVDEDFLYQISIAAKDHGAAGAIRPLVSTVIATTSEGFLDHSLERAKYRASEMPQGFLYDVIYQAYQSCSKSDFEFGTECLHLALQYSGTKAKLIEGPPTLWKVTYKRDLAAAESIVKETLSKRACVITGGSAQAQALAGALQERMAALDMELTVVPDISGDRMQCLSNEWNFLLVSAQSTSLSEVRILMDALEALERAVLHPVVIILVSTSTSNGTSVSTGLVEPAAMMELAAAAKLRNILLYCIQLPYLKDTEGCASTKVGKLAEITLALIHDRNPSLVGQLLQV